MTIYEPHTHFGNQTVPESEKAGRVKGVFDAVANRYDIMNDVMSGGLHRLWKNRLVEMLAPKASMQCLDVAGGTGDIVFRIHDYCLSREKAAPHIQLCDINDQMLQEGRKRAIDKGIIDGIDWLCGDAENLPISSNSVDSYTIAFGIRNVTHIDKALAEAVRVLKPGGRFLCLEFSAVSHPMLAKLYDCYSMQVIPKMGQIIAGDAAPYQYLVESIRRFPNQKVFATMISQAGFAEVSYHNLTVGTVAIHSGWKV